MSDKPKHSTTSYSTPNYTLREEVKHQIENPIGQSKHHTSNFERAL